MIKFIFCYNQISYVLAKEFDNQYNSINVIIFDGKRIKTRNQKFTEFHYSRLIAFLILLLCFIPFFFEIVIPHTKGGKLISLISRFSSNLSYIDDGMDSIRERPRNLDLDSLVPNMKYYSFNYKHPTANWLKKLQVIKLIGVDSLLFDTRDVFDFGIYQQVIIDSPGVSSVHFSSIGSIFITHPNKSKSTNFFNNCIKGNSIALEKSLFDYRGEIIVGESMVLIFLLNCIGDLSNLTVYLNESDYKNLVCLHSHLDLAGKVFIV